MYKNVSPSQQLSLIEVNRLDLSGTILRSDPPSASTVSAPDSNDIETQYTSTLFYLAQVYAHAGLKDKSAEYCAMTLRRQLEGGELVMTTGRKL